MIVLLATALPLAFTPNPTATNPIVLINEVQLDPAGPDAGFEWVELAFPNPVSPGELDGWSLIDHNGSVVFDFPRGATFPGNWHMCVFLGETRSGIASANLASRRAGAWFRGPTATNLLDDDAGALGVQAANSEIVDFVAWGHTAPPQGSALMAAVAASEWASGDFVDLSFDAPVPTFPGETVGRDKQSSDTNTALDWAGNGGADAVGATPAQQNEPRVEDVQGLIERSQELFVSSMAAYGFHPDESARFSVPDSGVGQVVVVGLGGLDFEVSASHWFVVEDKLENRLETWKGFLTARSLSCGSRCTRLEINGSVEGDSQNGLTISWEQDRSLSAGSIVQDLQTISLGLHLDGSDYVRSTVSSHQGELVAEGHMKWNGTRTESNWGNPASFDTTFEVDVVDISKTSRSMQSVLTMPYPLQAAPPLGSAAARGLVMTREVSSGVVDFASPEEYTFTRTVDYFLEQALVGQVIASSPAIDVVARASGDAGDVLGGILKTSSIPVRRPDGSPLFDIEVRTTQDSTRDGGKETTWIESIYERVDPDSTVTLLAKESFHIDPPLQATWIKGNPGETQTLYGGESLSLSSSRGMGRAVVPFGIFAVCVRVVQVMVATAPVTFGVGSTVGATSAAGACTAAGYIWDAFQ